MSRLRGFSLIELLVVIGLVAIAASVAVPAFSDLIERNRVTSTTNSVVGLLNYARAEALRRGRTVDVVSIGDDYEGGMAVEFGGNALRVIEPPPRGVTVSGTDIRFRGNGLSGVGAEITYQVCGQSGSSGSLVRVTQAGQIRSEPLACP